MGGPTRPVRRFRRILQNEPAMDRVQEGLANAADDLIDEIELQEKNVNAAVVSVGEMAPRTAAVVSDAAAATALTPALLALIPPIETLETADVSRDFYISLAAQENTDGTVWVTEEQDTGSAALVGGGGNDYAIWPMILPPDGTLTAWEIEFENSPIGPGSSSVSASIYKKNYADGVTAGVTTIDSDSFTSTHPSGLGDHTLSGSGLSETLGTAAYYLALSVAAAGGPSMKTKFGRVLKLTISTPELVKKWS